MVFLFSVDLAFPDAISVTLASEPLTPTWSAGYAVPLRRPNHDMDLHIPFMDFLATAISRSYHASNVTGFEWLEQGLDYPRP